MDEVGQVKPMEDSARSEEKSCGRGWKRNSAQLGRSYPPSLEGGRSRRSSPRTTITRKNSRRFPSNCIARITLARFWINFSSNNYVKIRDSFIQKVFVQKLIKKNSEKFNNNIAFASKFVKSFDSISDFNSFFLLGNKILGGNNKFLILRQVKKYIGRIGK